MGMLDGLLVVLALAGPPGAKPEDKYLETIKVSDQVYIFKPKIDWTHGNGVAIIGKDGVFFIDTYWQFNYAEEAIRRLRRVTKLPVRYILNTHWHNDHVMGNGVFKRIFPDCQIIAHDSTAKYMDTYIRKAVEGEAGRIQNNIDQVMQELHDGKVGRSGAPIRSGRWEV